MKQGMLFKAGSEILTLMKREQHYIISILLLFSLSKGIIFHQDSTIDQRELKPKTAQEETAGAVSRCAEGGAEG